MTKQEIIDAFKAGTQVMHFRSKKIYDIDSHFLDSNKPGIDSTGEWVGLKRNGRKIPGAMIKNLRPV